MNDTYWSWVEELLHQEEWWDEEEWVKDKCFDSNRGDWGGGGGEKGKGGQNTLDSIAETPTVSSSSSSSSSPPTPPRCKSPSAMLRAPEGPSQCLATEIHKDVLRTHPTISFFISPPSSSYRLSSLMRVLYVWAKLNKGVKYVQGMNEIAGVVAFVLGREDEWISELVGPEERLKGNEGGKVVRPISESMTYYLTSHLLNLHLDLFTPSLDNAFTGLTSSIETVTNLLSLHDPAVHAHLAALNIEGAFYLMRWVTTLLSREFNMPDTVRIWDVFFTNNLITPYVCVAMVELVRDRLMVMDFAGCLELLQNYPMEVDVERVVGGAKGLWVIERRVEECHKETGWGMRECVAAVGPVDGVVMAFGWRGGEVEGDFGETMKQVGGQIKLGAKEVAKDMGSVARSVGRGLLSWGKNVAKNMEKEMEKASEIRKEKERERNARMLMERMREERRRGEKEKEIRDGFLEQQRQFMETELKNNVEGRGGGGVEGAGGEIQGGGRALGDASNAVNYPPPPPTNETQKEHNPFK